MTVTIENPAPIQLVIGLGKTGLSCLRFLAAQGANIAVTDSRKEPPGLAELRSEFPSIPQVMGEFSTELCLRAQRLIVNPGVSLREPAIAAAIQQGIPAIGDIELFAQTAKAPIVAITGSNGKSTVTTLVGEMAKTAQWRVRVGGEFRHTRLGFAGGAGTRFICLRAVQFSVGNYPFIACRGGGYPEFIRRPYGSL